MNLIDIVKLSGVSEAEIKETKIVRHQDKRFDVAELIRYNQFEYYQSFQGREVFKCKQILSFIGTEGTKAKFYGFYQVKGKKRGQKSILPKDFIYPEMETNDCWYYNLERTPFMNEFENRLVIDWGRNTRNWVQWLAPKEIVEILPKGYVKEFPGYLDFILNYDELKKIIENPQSNREWYRMLSAVAGVYLILDQKTGYQYVGSAYGDKGIWGRWAQYVRNGHGGNKKLIDLIEGNPDHKFNFQFSIIRTLPKELAKNEVISFETKNKEKLGSRSFGLNEN